MGCNKSQNPSRLWLRKAASALVSDKAASSPIEPEAALFSNRSNLLSRETCSSANLMNFSETPKILSYFFSIEVSDFIVLFSKWISPLRLTYN